MKEKAFQALQRLHCANKLDNMRELLNRRYSKWLKIHDQMRDSDADKIVQAASDLFGRPCNGSLFLAVLAGLETNQYAGCQRNRCGVASHFLAGCLQWCIALLGDGGISMPRRIPGISIARHKLQHARLLRANQNGRTSF